MSWKSRRTLQLVSGWEAVELIIQCVFLGAWQLMKIAFTRLWKGHRRKFSKNAPQLTVDSSIGTHCYIKILGVKYHYVETGPKEGEVILVLGDAPDPSSVWCSGWIQVVKKLASSGHRVVSLDLRGTGGSEGGNSIDLSPPRAIEELHALLEAFGVSENNPAVIIGHGIGGMLTWFLVHSHPSLVRKFVVIGAPHPNLYWQYPVAPFCQDVLHFLQWPFLPERWLAESELSADGTPTSNERWSSRACDWSGALNYIRGAAWWRIKAGHQVTCPGLLVGARGHGAAQLVASAQHCVSPTLRLVNAAHASSADLPRILIHYLIDSDMALDSSSEKDRGPSGGGLMTRVFGAVAGRGRELTAAVSRARLVLPSNTPVIS